MEGMKSSDTLMETGKDRHMYEAKQLVRKDLKSLLRPLRLFMIGKPKKKSQTPEH